MKLNENLIPQTPRQKAFMKAFTRATSRSQTLRLTKNEKAVFTNYLKRLQTAFGSGADNPPTVPGMP